MITIGPFITSERIEAIVKQCKTRAEALALVEALATDMRLRDIDRQKSIALMDMKYLEKIALECIQVLEWGNYDWYQKDNTLIPNLRTAITWFENWKMGRKN